jgi:protein O-GlcNAc transferase
LRQLRERLARNRLSGSLFDTPRFTRELEAAYGRIYTRWRAGLEPEHVL